MSLSYPLSLATPAFPSPNFPEAAAVGSPPASQNPQILLAEVFDLCNIDWVRSFLFTSDPIHVHALNSPDFTSSALTGTLTASRYLHGPETSDAQPEPFQNLVDNIVIVQDFAAAGVIVGHGVKESSVESGAAWIPDLSAHSSGTGHSFDAAAASSSSNSSISMSQTPFFNMRFAIAPERQTAFFVYDAPAHDAVVLRCSRYQSASLVHMTKLVIARAPFLSLMRSSASLHASTILPLVRLLQHELQARPCQPCALSRPVAAHGCRCHLAAPAPRHPRDIANFATVMAGQVGDYAGIARVGFHRLVSYVQVRGVVDPSMTARLRDWALHGYVTRVTSPRKQAVFSVSDRAAAEASRIGPGESGESNGAMTGEAAWDVQEEDQRVNGSSDRDLVDAEEAQRAKRRAALERRREKNRISASRCNQRKREHRIWLEGEVRRGGERVRELRERERALLQENRKLNQELHGGQRV